MREQLLNHIIQYALFGTSDRILVAVSGGVDSMVLLHLLHTEGYNLGVAHCNFQLRGADADGDEALVRNTCAAYNIPCHVKRFDTQAYADANKLSIQMAARTLRYNFFDTLRQEQGYTHLATAHHAGDSLETLLLNLVRGTGLDGLTGIPVRNGFVVRPLLFATRAHIAAYATAHGVVWREDSSNQSDYYHRNLLRNQVLPLLRKINPQLDEGFTASAERLSGAKALAGMALDSLRHTLITHADDRIQIDRVKLALQPAPAVILWELIKPMGFTYDQCKTICREHQTGSRFYTDTYALVVDRDVYMVIPHTEHIPGSVNIAQQDAIAHLQSMTLTLETLTASQVSLSHDPGIAHLDWDKIQFPLTWRTWKPGDAFVPLGMKQAKKISDFLIDRKTPLPDKARVTVLVAGEDIVWVTGMRISDRFKVTPATQQVLRIQLDTTRG